MEEEVTAVQAAQMTGRSDRTIRRLIHDKKLPARLVAPNRYAIKVSDLDKLTGHETGQIADVEKQLVAIEESLTRMEGLLGDLLETISKTETSKREQTTSQRPVPIVTNDTISAPPDPPTTALPNNLPPGTLTLSELADELGISRTTLLGHCTKKKDRLNHEARELQSRPGQYARFFTPEQAMKARAWHIAHSKK